MDVIRDHLIALYGERLGDATFEKLSARLRSSPVKRERVREGANLSARDAILITYGDQLHEPDRAPLHTLAEFCEQHLHGVVSGIHMKYDIFVIVTSWHSRGGIPWRHST